MDTFWGVSPRRRPGSSQPIRGRCLSQLWGLPETPGLWWQHQDGAHNRLLKYHFSTLEIFLAEACIYLCRVLLTPVTFTGPWLLHVLYNISQIMLVHQSWCVRPTYRNQGSMKFNSWACGWEVTGEDPLVGKLIKTAAVKMSKAAPVEPLSYTLLCWSVCEYPHSPHQLLLQASAVNNIS